MAQPQRAPSANPGQMSGGGIFDAETQQKLRQLEMDKALAVQGENYDLAKSLRDQIERLKSVGMQL